MLRFNQSKCVDIYNSYTHILYYMSVSSRANLLWVSKHDVIEHCKIIQYMPKRTWCHTMR